MTGSPCPGEPVMGAAWLSETRSINGSQPNPTILAHWRTHDVTGNPVGYRRILRLGPD